MLNITENEKNIIEFETFTRISESDNFSSKLKKLNLNFSSNRERFKKFINKKVVQAINLKELIVFNSAKYELKLNNSFLRLTKLEKLNLDIYNYTLSNIETIAKLPHLKEFTVSDKCSETQAKIIQETLKNNGSIAIVVIEELPF